MAQGQEMVPDGRDRKRAAWLYSKVAKSGSPSSQREGKPPLLQPQHHHLKGPKMRGREALLRW